MFLCGHNFVLVLSFSKSPRSEPVCVTLPRSESDQPHIRSPLWTAAPISRLRRTKAQENETILKLRRLSPRGQPVRSPGSSRTDQVLEERDNLRLAGNGAVDDNAGFDIFPQGDQELARQGDNGSFAQAATLGVDPGLEPLGER